MCMAMMVGYAAVLLLRWADMLAMPVLRRFGLNGNVADAVLLHGGFNLRNAVGFGKAQRPVYYDVAGKRVFAAGNCLCVNVVHAVSVFHLPYGGGNRVDVGACGRVSIRMCRLFWVTPSRFGPMGRAISTLITGSVHVRPKAGTSMPAAIAPTEPSTPPKTCR